MKTHILKCITLFFHMKTMKAAGIVYSALRLKNYCANPFCSVISASNSRTMVSSRQYVFLNESYHSLPYNVIYYYCYISSQYLIKFRHKTQSFYSQNKQCHFLLLRHLRLMDLAFSSTFSLATSAIRLVSLIMYCLITARNSNN